MHIADAHMHVHTHPGRDVYSEKGSYTNTRTPADDPEDLDNKPTGLNMRQMAGGL